MLIYFAELRPALSSTGVEQVLRFCSSPTWTRADGVDWLPMLAVPFRRDTQVFDGQFQSQPQDYGALEFGVSRGQPITPLTSMVWDGRPVKIWRGLRGQNTAAMTVVFDGTAESVSGKRSRVTVKLRGPNINLPVLPTFYAGTGSAEGPTDLKSTPKPVLLGSATNLEPVYVNRALGIFQYHSSGAATGITAVYDSGSQLGASIGDYANYAALAAATVPGGSWASCNALGLGRHGGSITGILTIDAVGAVSSGLPGAIIKWLLRTHLGLAATKVKEDSLDWLDAQLPYPQDIFVTSQIDAEEFCSNLMLSLGGYIWWTESGMFTIGLLRRGGASAAVIGQNCIAETPVLRETSAPVWKRSQGWRRSWRVHSYSEVRTPKELNPRGNWSASPTPVYQYYDLVDWANSSWVYVNATLGNGATPGTDATVWQYFRSNGAAVVDSTTTPTSPVEGMLWRNSSNGQLRVYIGGTWLLSADVTLQNTAAAILGQAATATSSDFASVTGTTKPSDNAGTSLVLSKIGTTTNVSIRGNSISKVAGGSTFDSGVVSPVPLRGNAFVQVDISAVSDNMAIVLDDDLTTFARDGAGAATVYFQYNRATGNWGVYAAGAGLYGASIGTGVTGVLSIVYDGLTFDFFINSTLLFSTPTTANQTLYAKWFSYDYNTQLTGLQSGYSTDRAWSNLGGATKPADNAGTTVLLTALGANPPIIQGNQATKVAASNAFDSAACGLACVGSAYVTASRNGNDECRLALGQVQGNLTPFNNDFFANVTAAGGWYLYVAGTQVASGTAGNGSLTLAYTGSSVIVLVDGVKVTTYTTGVAPNLVLYPKVLIYYAAVFNNIFMGYWQDTTFGAIGGDGKPQDNATLGSNLLPNSSFLVDTSGWTLVGSAARVAASAGDPSPFVRMSAGGADGHVQYNGDTLRIGAGHQRIYWSYWLRYSALAFNSSYFIISCYDAAGNNLGTVGDYNYTTAVSTSGSRNFPLGQGDTPNPPKDGQWSLLVGSLVLPAGTASLRYLDFYTGPAAGTTKDITGFTLSTTEIVVSKQSKLGSLDYNATSGDNLIQNGDFSDGLSGLSIPGAVTPYVSTVPGLSGDPTLRFLRYTGTAASGTVQLRATQIPVTGGKKYWLDLKLRSSVAGTPIQIVFVANDKGGSFVGYAVISSPSVAATNILYDLKYPFTPASNVATIDCYITFNPTTSAQTIDIAAVRLSSIELNATLGATIATDLRFTDQSIPTRAVLETSLGTAAAIVGQAPTATSSDFAVVTGDTKPEASATSGSNLIFNGNAESGAVGFYEIEGSGGTLVASAAHASNGALGLAITKTATSTATGWGSRAIAVVPGRTYVVRINLSGSTAETLCLFLRMNEKSSAPSNGVYITAAERTSLTQFLSAADVPSTRTSYQFFYTAPAGVLFASAAIYNWTNGPLTLRFDDFTMIEAIDLSSQTSSYLDSSKLTKTGVGYMDSFWPATTGADRTINATAAAFTGQGALATLGSVAYGSAYVTGFGAMAARVKVSLGDGFTFRADGTTALSDALLVTSLGTAAAITGQAPTATSSDFASVTGATKPEANADVTSTSQVICSLTPIDRTIVADYAGTITGVLGDLLWIPVVTKGGVNKRLDNLTTYALSSAYGGTFAVDNTNGSTTKGQVTVSAMSANSATVVLTVNYNSIQVGRFTLNLDKVLGAAPSSGGTIPKTVSWTNGDYVNLNTTTYTAVVTPVKTVAVAAGESLYVSAAIDYIVSGTSGNTRTMSFKTQLSVAGANSWSDFGAATTGSTAQAAVSLGPPDYYIDEAIPGNATWTQTKATPGAGNWDVRVVAICSSTGRTLTCSGSVSIQAKV